MKKTPLDKRRMSVWELASGEKSEGLGWILPLGELAQGLLHEHNKRKDSLEQTENNLTEGDLEKRKQAIADLEWAIGLCLRDSRLTAIDLRINVRALDMLEREILGEEEAVQSILKFEAEMRKRGCPAIFLSGPPGAPSISAFGERDAYFQSPLRSGARTHAPMPPLPPLPAGFEREFVFYDVTAPRYADLRAVPDWPPQEPATIVVSAEAYAALAKTMRRINRKPADDPEINSRGDRTIMLEPRTFARFDALRGPNESYSDVIIRLAEATRDRANN